MATVETILKTKGREVFSVTPSTTILEALKLMADKGVGALMVMEKDEILGIFSERDYARRGVLLGNTEKTTVDKVMTKKVFSVSLEQSVDACMAQMRDQHFRHLPVLKNGKIIGVISINDVAKTLLNDKETLIKGLESFLVGQDFKR
ncbi:MAG: CBS domain-containing protein [Chloroflexi bacterium]|nr:CBS domain-containing protein [Chloroflexota bacterium]